jgi:hypothetical protein
MLAMPSEVLMSKDFWSGLLFIGMGTAALVLGSNLRVGTAARMGPGFVPHSIGWILVSLGTAIALKGIIHRDGSIGTLHLRPLLFIVLSVVAFALLLQPAGLVPALAALVTISGFARPRASLLETAAIAAVLIGLCVLIFKLGLEMSFPVIAGVW